MPESESIQPLCHAEDKQQHQPLSHTVPYNQRQLPQVKASVPGGFPGSKVFFPWAIGMVSVLALPENKKI